MMYSLRRVKFYLVIAFNKNNIDAISIIQKGLITSTVLPTEDVQVSQVTTIFHFLADSTKQLQFVKLFVNLLKNC